MKKLLLFILLVLLHSTCNNRYSKRTTSQKDFLELETITVRKKPILNREYIVFLSWYIETYGFSYPEKILQILPKNSVDANAILAGNYQQLTTTTAGILSQYILNPKYLNYPLMGLNTQQVLEMQKWLGDRYNENRLIEMGILNFNPEQMDEDCFVTESYLADQYMGDLRQDKFIDWQDKELLPAFRLPFKEELTVINNKLKGIDKIQAYEFSKRDFLWRWDAYFIFTNLDTNEFTVELLEPLTFTSQSDYVFPKEVENYAIQETRVNSYKPSFYPKLAGVREIEDLENYPFEEKDEFGHMNFIIIGTDKSGKPVAIPKNFQGTRNNEPAPNKISMLVYNKVIN